jgi:hypothetical protein
MLVALGLAIVGVSRADDKAAVNIKGLTGNFARLNFDKANAGTAQSITVTNGSKIEIEYTYLLSPPLPQSVGARTSDPNVVKVVEIDTVQLNTKLLDQKNLGAFFHAVGKGKAKIDFDINTDSGTGLILQVDVTVN